MINENIFNEKSRSSWQHDYLFLIQGLIVYTIRATIIKPPGILLKIIKIINIIPVIFLRDIEI